MPLFWIVLFTMTACATASVANALARRTTALQLRDLRGSWLLMVLRRMRIRRQQERATRELPAFSTWLRRHRGIQETTIRGYAREIGILLQAFDISPEHYDAKRVRDVLMCRFGQISRSHAKKVAISMRMYLRFLATIGACAPGLIGAVPTVRSWRLASLPRYRSPDVIERVVSACNTATAVGLRDRAILLLLARLALRAGDVAGLRLSDIDWANARLIVCGKSKRSVGLPLPQDAGDAVLAYIEQARPQVDQEKLFLRVVAPHRPFVPFKRN